MLVPGARLPCNARVVPEWGEPPEWEEPDQPWTVVDEALLAATMGARGQRARSRYPWYQRARHALVRFLAAPLTVYRLRRAGWTRRGWRSWEPPAG